MQQDSNWWERFKQAEWNWFHPGPNEIHPWRWRALGLWIVVFTGIAIFTLNDSSNTSVKAKLAAVQAKSATRKIQTQRSESIRRGCNDQNQRHTHTIKTLRVILVKQILRAHLATPEGEKKLKKSGGNLTFNQIIDSVPASKQNQVSQSVGTTLLLIDSLAPKQNCDELVKTSVKSPPQTTKEHDNAK